MTFDNGRINGIGNSYSTWAVRVHTASRVARLGTGYLVALRHEMLSVINRIDDELKRREQGQH